MNNQNPTYDWMLVTVRGYDLEKGYIFGNRHPDGKGVIIAKKHSVRRDWVKSLSSEKERTFTPPQSVIAVFGAEEKDSNSGFTIASWATPISKNLGQEDVYVTPIKVTSSPRPIKNSNFGDKKSYIDAVVLDVNATEVRTLEDLQSCAISMLDTNAKTALKLDGSRGFMIRIGHTAPDGSLEASGWEFFGRKSSTPEQTWNFHWNQKPQQGLQHNLLHAVLTAARSAFNDPGSYVEVVGCTRSLINDFGDQKRVEELAALPNYKTTVRNNVVPSYSLAAITVEKHGVQRVIKQQTPLPRNKVINHLAGVLGNHVPGIRMPVVIEPIKATGQNEETKSNSVNMQENTGTYPLLIADYVNEQGEVRSFRVKGTKQAIDTYQAQIENAVPGLKPFRVKGEIGYSFPLKYRKEVESVLSDLAGTPPLYISEISIKSKPYITVSGKVNDPRYSVGLDRLFDRLGVTPQEGQYLLDETKRSELVTGINSIANLANQDLKGSEPPTKSNSTEKQNQNVSAPTNQPALSTNVNIKTRSPTTSFSDWLQMRFGKDPYAMLDFLDGEVNAYAEEAGIDWDSARTALAFGSSNQRGKLVKSRDVRPLNKGHTGSVAMAAHLHEKQGTKPGDSIVWFKINFFNKKMLKDDVVTFDSYPLLKDEYDRDVKNGIKPSSSTADLEAIRKRNEERQQAAQLKFAQQAQEDQDSRNYWARRIPTMPREDGANQYFVNKGIVHLLSRIDARSGDDKQGRFTIIPLHDINLNFMGAQRIYENYWEDDKGKRTNKNFIRGTLFKDDRTDLPYGTHYLVGHIDPEKPIVFCEGVADSGTDHAATGLPTVICMNKGNLYHVVGLYRQKYPNTRLIIASDNDFYNKRKGNVGFSAALDSARDHNAEYVVPSFKGLDTSSKPTDFNDLEKIAGLDVVRTQFRNVRVTPADPLEFHKLKVQVVGLDNLEKHINSAVTEIVESGNHGVDENRIYRALVNRAFLAYGRDDVVATLGRNASEVTQEVITNESPIIDEKNKPTFPVEIRERNGTNGKKYALVVDHSGNNSIQIQAALNNILGPKHLPFNEHLNGWVAPYPVIRLLNCFLHNTTGASQLYIGQSRSKSSGAHFVVRGDFTDSTFKSKIEKSIKYSSPEYNQSEYGFVIPDSRAIPYIKETLRSYLVSNRDLDTSIVPPTTEVPQVNQTLLDEAVRISGQGRGDVVLAHYALLFKDSNNIFLDTDFVFSSIYSRSVKSFSHLEPDVKHQKALEDACRNARSMLDTGVGKTVASESTLHRLNELVTHLEFILTHIEPTDKTIESLTINERDALEFIADKINVDINTANAIIQGSNQAPKGQLRDSVLSEYQAKLSDLVEVQRKNQLQLETANELKTTPTHVPVEIAERENANLNISNQEEVKDRRSLVNQEQLDRINKLLEIVRLVVDKGFDEEDLYDIFITQAGSPYHEKTSDTFNDILYRQDMRVLSTSEEIPGWKPTNINTTSQLYYVIYNEVAKRRLEELESYVNSYFGQNGVTTYKTFNKYFSGQQKMAADIVHPYIMEGEINHDLINQDLEHLTDFMTIHEFYRAISSEFEKSQISINEGQGDIFTETYNQQNPAEISGEIISETAAAGFRAKVTEYNIRSQQVFEIIVDIEIDGRWERSHHGFNLQKEIALNQIEAIRNQFQNNTEFDAGALPGGTKGSVSISTIAKESGNGLVIEHREVDTGPDSFYFIIEKHNEAGVEVTVDCGIFENYQGSTKAFQNLYKEHRETITAQPAQEKISSRIMVQPVAPAPLDLGERFREWARKSEPFDVVRETLISQYKMTFTDESLAGIKDQYLKLIEKLKDESQIKESSPDKKYDLLYDFTLNLASKELTYDEYVEEFFNSEGQYVDQNPYWKADKNQIDRRAVFTDLKSAGYQSLSQFYDGIFQSIHHRSSNDLLFRRVGGYIPTSLDVVQPFRPQFSNLEQLFHDSGLNSNVPDHLPPFNDWATSNEAYDLLHPILAEDLNNVSPDDLSANYSKDAMLMFADIHGVAINTDMTLEELSHRITSQWKTRTLLSNMTSTEIKDLDELALTDFLVDMSLPSNAKHQDKCNRLIGHIEQLRSISKLRIAQYSYINAALQMEGKGKTIPNYVYRGITEFIANETAFKDSADRAIEQASTSQLRKNVEIAVRLLTDISPMERVVLNASDPSFMKVVGIDQDKQSALVFSDNYDNTKATANRYRFKYVIPVSENTSNVSLPGHLTHHGIFSERVIGTASSLDTNFLLTSGYRPLSVDAMVTVAAPIERWMEKNGYCGFFDSDGKSLIAAKDDDRWTLNRISHNSLEVLGRYQTPQLLLQQLTDSIQGFSDRDILIEEWIKACGTTFQQPIDALQRVIRGDNISEDQPALSSALSNEALSHLLADHVDESLAVKTSLAARGLLDSIRQEAWEQIVSGRQPAKSVIEDVEGFIANFQPRSSTSNSSNENTTEVSQFYSLTPVEASALYDEYLSSDKNQHSEIFDSLSGKYFGNMSQKDKHALALDISGGAYENLGHFLHECDLKHALLSDLPGAKEIAETYYSDLEIDIPETVIQSSDSETEDGDYVLVVYQDDSFKFGKIVSQEGDEFACNVLTQAKISGPAKAAGLYADDGTYLPGLSINEFSTREEALAAPAPYLDIDPRTEKGRDDLLKLKLSELSDYAYVMGANHKGERVDIINAIDDFIFTKTKIINSKDSTHESFTASDLGRMGNVLGDVINQRPLNEALTQWVDDKALHTINELSRRNMELLKIQEYGEIKDMTTMTIDASSEFRVDVSKESVVRVHGLPDARSILGEISGIKDLAGWLNSASQEKRVSAYICLDLLSITPNKILEDVSKIPAGINVVPSLESSQIMWRLKGNQANERFIYDTLASAVDAAEALKLGKPNKYIDGDLVAWLDSNKLKLAHIADADTDPTGKLSASFTDMNGRSYIAELENDSFLVLNEEDIEAEFQAKLANFSGDSKQIILVFEQNLSNTQDDSSLADTIKAHYFKYLAEERVKDISKHESLLPEGYGIEQYGNEYVLKVTGTDNTQSLNLSSTYESLSELARNVAIQQRVITTEQENNHAKTPRATMPTQSMGTDSQEPSREDASKAQQHPQEKERMDNNVVNIAGKNRESDGDDDDSPDDQPPGPGNGRIRNSSSLPSKDSPAGSRNSVRTTSPRTRGIGFHLSETLESDVSGGPDRRLRLNLDALRLRKELLESNRNVTDEDRETLSKYTGWGGLSSIFEQHYGYNKDRSELVSYLQDGEYEDIKRSVLTAFYTPPSVTAAMWSALERFGFEGGKILDPSTGTGQYIGSTPQNIARKSAFIGKEIEPVSASIAQFIYGSERIHKEPYEKSKLPNNYFDLAISNIPFGDIKVFDSEYKKHNFRIHDYFFSKSLDKVKPGGVVAFITTTGTMDRKDPTVREHLYEQADLLGAIRLPRKTFKGYAGTDVSADIIFLQKRLPNQVPKDDSWLWSIDHEFKTQGSQDEFEELAINRYFLDKSEMVVGDIVVMNGRHGPELVTAYSGEKSISQEIFDRVNLLPSDVMNLQSTSPSESVNTLQDIESSVNSSSTLLKPGSYVVNGGQIGIIEPIFIEDTGTYQNKVIPYSISTNDSHRLASMIAIRDTTKGTINLQLGVFTTEELKNCQQTLNNQYDNFVKDYGFLNDAKNKRLFSSDPDSALLLALEKPNINRHKFEKTDIFTKATISNNTIPEHADTANDALNISLGVKGTVDPEYISSLVGENWETVLEELDEAVYLDPRSHQWQPKEQYLAGNIREKLQFARDAAQLDRQFDRNVDGLEAVLPDPIPAYDIKVRLGATWIPEEVISKFVEHIIVGASGNFKAQNEFSVSQHAASWVVKVDTWQLSINEGRVTQEWGTKRLGAHELIDKLLNNRQISVKDKLDDGTYVINRDETIAANQKADTIAQEFRDWIWSDSGRTKRLEKMYNDRYNVFVEPKYTGNSVRLDGISPELKGKPLEARDSQKAAIQRYILEGRSLNAHPVGAGKTLEIVGSAMEGKRLGVHKKPLIVVPNNILSQFGRMALELYPGANALVIDPKQLTKDARKLFTARIATSNWDMIVIAQSSFDKIATPIEHQKAVIEDERYQLQEALQELSATDNRAAQLTVKRLERALDNLETKIESLADVDKKDNFLYLNEIGVDALFVDEADNYLNLYTPTQMGHVPGVNTSASQRAMNMFMAVRYIQELNGDNKGVIFATGTDIRNSMSDMYTMLRYLGPDVLEASGATNFDSFMGTFGEVVKTIEVNPEGTGYRENSRLSKFTNIPEMVLMYRQVADVLTDQQLQLPKPKVDEINVAAESGDWLAMYMAYLASRAKATRTGAVSNRDDNLLKIASDGRKASLDMRLVDSRIPDDPRSKVNLCVKNILKEWEEGKDKRLTQIVFCDLGVPKKNVFNIYGDIRDKLIAAGIPEKEIAFSQDYKTDSKKKELEGALNSGDIRVVIASTETLGVGSNVQEKLVAQHNLDAPWRPRDLEQRGGRMERPGNSNKQTRRYNYAQTDSFDLFMWETLKRKAAFIQQAKVDPRSAAREIDEDLNPTYSELMAITTGNPLIRKKIEIDSSVERLQSAERSHKRAQWDNTNQIRSHKNHIHYIQESIESNKRLLCAYQANNTELSIGNTIYTDPKKAASAISILLKKHTENTVYKPIHTIPLGSIGTLPLQLSYLAATGRWVLQTGDNKNRTVSEHKSVRGMVDGLLQFDNELQRDIRWAERDIQRHEAAIASLQESATKPFKHKNELDGLLAEQRELNTELSNAANDEVAEQHKKVPDFEQELESISKHAPKMRVG
jgi:N12 class adenine-specific DNA methylase/phage/plasmid primase-like uncharacterized protein